MKNKETFVIVLGIWNLKSNREETESVEKNAF